MISVFSKAIIFCFCCFVFQAMADNNPIIFPKDHNEHDLATTEVWMFTGEIETEEGNKYAYMFRLKRKKTENENEQKLSVFANIVDLSSNNQVLVYKHTKRVKVKASVSTTPEAQFLQWKVGKAFMKYNVIGDSWMFGILDDANGFNFRVKGIRTYVLNGKEGYLLQQKNSFAASYSAQNMSINGHLTLEGKSNFVAGKNSWFEHHWGTGLSGQNTSKYALITCRFNDNTGLMLYEWFGAKDFWPGRLKTGTYQNALDKKVLVSNFSLVKSAKTNQWLISIPGLKLNISALSDSIPEYDVIQVKNNKEGYCFVSQKGF